MSITVAKCLELPAMRDAKVVAGKDGLNKIVSSVSVLEYAHESVLKSELFVGNEFIISAFVNVKEDLEMQCKVLRQLHKQGVVALAIYYVGVFLPKIEDELKAVADELGVPLIMMPENRFDYRYSEAISDIMSAIFSSQKQESFFVPMVLETVFDLPENNRTMSNLLRILSNRLHCTIVAVNRDLQKLESATWPTHLDIDYDGLIEHYSEDLQNARKPIIPNAKIVRDAKFNTTFSVQMVGISELFFLVVQDAETLNHPFDEYILQQIAEAIHLFMNSAEYPKRIQNSDALVRAFLYADSYLMNQIAKQTGMNIKSLQSMWLLMGLPAKNDQKEAFINVSNRIRAKSFLMERYKNPIVGNLDSVLVLLMGAPILVDYEENAAEDFMNVFSDANQNALLLCLPKFNTALEAGEFYLTAQDNWYALKTIFPLQRVFDANDLRFAKACRSILQKGESEVRKAMKPMEALLSTDTSGELVETLSIFLLDANGSVSRTANIIFLHQNSVKYRLKTIKTRLQQDVFKLPGSYELYLAVAIKRLSSSL